MTASDAPDGISTDAEPHPSWTWATLLAIHPCLIAVALVGLLLFGLTGAVTSASHLPEFLRLLPGVPAMVALGVVYIYTPIYLAGLILDFRQIRRAGVAWNPSRWVLSAGGAQAIYFVVPIVQAYDGGTFDELVFGSVELATLLVVGVMTVRYLDARDTRFPNAPRLVSLWSSVWSKALPGDRTLP